MSETRNNDDRFEGLLREVRVPGPSRELKARVTGAAAKAWSETSADVPWQIVFRRLGVSAAAAVFVISLANYSVDRMLSAPRFGHVATARQSVDLDGLPEVIERPFVQYMASSSVRGPVSNASTLRDYLERVDSVLEETLQNGVSDGPAPVEGRSRLAPGQGGFDSYS